jgi:hypothetical protein
MEQPDEFTTEQRAFCTQKYLEYTDSRGYDHNQSVEMITLFWQKVDEYPAHIESCHEAVRKTGRSIPIDTSRHLDLDYAARFAGISADYIWQLMGVFAEAVLTR